jgi:FkbM family methyltransferase
MGEAIDLALPCPQPVASTWLEELRRLGDGVALRASLCARLPALAPGRINRIAIVGAASEGRRLAALCEETSIRVVAIADDQPSRQGHSIGRTTVVPVDDLVAVDRDVPVVIASHRPLQLLQRLRAMGFTTVAMFLVLQVTDPERFPPHMFYDGWFEDLAAHADRYAALSDILADDRSRQHLDAIIGFRLTADIGVIAPIVDWDVYAPKDLVSFSSDEVYVDAGAFDGDSICVFMDRVGDRFSRVIAFEPDPQTYGRLVEKFAGDPRIHALPKGVYSHAGHLRFVNDGSRGAIFAHEGSVEIPVTTLDEELADGRVTFVKMNIEGAEMEALRGGAKAISRWGPRLAISAYHRPSDLWQIPFLIRELRPQYRLALRQHDAGAIETVAYGL